VEPHFSAADEIAKLADLRDRGLLTDEDFNRQKSALLARAAGLPIARSGAHHSVWKPHIGSDGIPVFRAAMGAVLLLGLAAGLSYVALSGRSTGKSAPHRLVPTTTGNASPSTMASASTTTSSPTLRTILAPATAPPVSDECTLQLTYDADGNVTPLLCPSGGVNVLAWQHYAGGSIGSESPRPTTVMELGPYASPPQVYQAMCSDYVNIFGTNPLTISAEELSASYYGWKFAGDDPVADFEQAVTDANSSCE